MAVTQGWQVTADQLNILQGGATVTKYRDEVLPATTDPGELAQRAALVTGGLLRVVEVAVTGADAAQAVSDAARAELAGQLAEHQAESGQPEPAAAQPQPEVDTPGGGLVDEG
jgi:hypothetical protein